MDKSYLGKVYYSRHRKGTHNEGAGNPAFRYLEQHNRKVQDQTWIVEEYNLHSPDDTRQRGQHMVVPEDESSNLTLTDAIVAKTIVALKARPELFDSVMINEFRRLAGEGLLTNDELVETALKELESGEEL